MRVFKKTIRGEIVDSDGDHQRVWRLSRIVFTNVQDVVCQNRFMHISARAEQLAGRRESLGDLGDDSRGPENRELRAERGEQVTPVTLSAMIGMNGDLVNEGTGRSLGADEDADRIGARKGN